MSPRTDINSSVNKLAVVSNGFGFNLLAQLIEQDKNKNVFISPALLIRSLLMVSNGASGPTKQIILDTLGLNEMTLQEVNGANNELQVSMENLDINVQLILAESLWGRRGLTFKDDFIRRVVDYYRAEVTNLDFTDPSAPSAINTWVQKKTNRQIDMLVKPGDLDINTVLVLLNAIYFRGSWSVQFNTSETKEGVFTLSDGKQKQQPMMYQSGCYNYYDGESFQIINLPYGQGRTSMYVVLPNRNVILSEFKESLRVYNWERWISQLRYAEGDISLPRFKLKYETELSKALTNLGMGIVFGADANFQGMTTEPVWISQVKHKALVEVNEEGTEAAAVAAVVMMKAFAPKRFNLVIDHPFFWAIRDNQTGLIIFLGLIQEPQ